MDKNQKLINVNIYSDLPETTAHFLTNAASDGYCYGGHTAQLNIIGDTNLTRNYDVQNDSCLLWLNPASGGSLFHAWCIYYRQKNLLEELNRLIEYENSIGFNLTVLIQMDRFTKDVTGLVTDAYYALFEWRPENRIPPMLDRWTLKQERIITQDGVDCPVIGCDFVAPRMKANDLNLDISKKKLSDFLCPKHLIYISPSPFEYAKPTTSILWPEDKETVIKISKSGKRTWSRMGRERDEDSLVWNVLRYLEHKRLLGKLFEDVIGFTLGAFEKIIYWSVDIEKMAVCDGLWEARKMIGESASRGSEPDIIAVFENVIVLIEAKLDSTVITTVNSIPAYYTDENGVFKKNLQDAASSDGIGYELTRYFLLGEVLRDKLCKKSFVVVSLTKDDVNDDLVTRVNSCVNLNSSRHYHWLTWGQLYSFIQKTGNNSIDSRILLRYLKGKTLGYSIEGKLRTLFP